MTEEQLRVTKRALSNILTSMIKAQDAPASSEMHLIESVVDLAHILQIDNFNDNEMNEQFSYCADVMSSLRKTT